MPTTRRRPRSSSPRRGYPNGFDGETSARRPRTTRRVKRWPDYLQAVGIRTANKNDGARRVPHRLERQDSCAGVCMCSVGTHGNAATRMGNSCPARGSYAYGGWPDVDALWKQQARETDKKKREALLQQIQQIAFDRVRFAGHLGLRLAERRRAAGGRAGVPADRPVSVVRAVRGAAPQEVRRRRSAQRGSPRSPARRTRGARRRALPVTYYDLGPMDLRSTRRSRVDRRTQSLCLHLAFRVGATGAETPVKSGVTRPRSPGGPYDPAHPSCPDSGKARQRPVAAHSTMPEGLLRGLTLAAFAALGR